MRRLGRHGVGTERHEFCADFRDNYVPGFVRLAKAPIDLPRNNIRWDLYRWQQMTANDTYFGDKKYGKSSLVHDSYVYTNDKRGNEDVGYWRC